MPFTYFECVVMEHAWLNKNAAASQTSIVKLTVKFCCKLGVRKNVLKNNIIRCTAIWTADHS